MTPANNTPEEFALRIALSALADKYGKAEAQRVFEEWRRTKIEEAAA